MFTVLPAATDVELLTYPAARRSGARPSAFVSELPRRSQHPPSPKPPDRCSSLSGRPFAGVPIAVSRACAVIGGLGVAAGIAADASAAAVAAGEEEAAEEDK